MDAATVSLEDELETQMLKRELQEHYANEHNELLALEDIEVVILTPSCNCDAGVDFNTNQGRGYCPRCGKEAIQT